MLQTTGLANTLFFLIKKSSPNANQVGIPNTVLERPTRNNSKCFLSTVQNFFMKAIKSRKSPLKKYKICCVGFIHVYGLLSLECSSLVLEHHCVLHMSFLTSSCPSCASCCCFMYWFMASFLAINKKQNG